MDVACRVDSSTEMGVGHIMRCLTLADGLRKKNVSVTFVCRDLPGHLGDLVIEKGYMLKLLPRPISDSTKKSNIWLKTLWDIDVNQTIAAVGTKVDLLIIDHYGIDEAWHRKASSITSKIMVIDDLANRCLYCDLLLDQTFGRKESAYLRYVGSETTILCGTRYALLRDQFSEHREAAINKRNSFSGIKQILVNFGGADYTNMSSKVLSVLSTIEFTHVPSIDVVLGESSLFMDEIRRKVEDYKLNVKIFSYVENMAALMLKADVAIGAGGSTSWERCTLGLPTLLFVNAENQLLIAQNLEEAGAVTVIDKNILHYKDMTNTLIELDVNHDKYRFVSRAASKICDGLGVGRVVDKILSFS